MAVVKADCAGLLDRLDLFGLMSGGSARLLDRATPGGFVSIDNTGLRLPSDEARWRVRGHGEKGPGGGGRGTPVSAVFTPSSFILGLKGTIGERGLHRASESSRPLLA